jgi:hypothetical protein
MFGATLIDGKTGATLGGPTGAVATPGKTSTVVATAGTAKFSGSGSDTETKDNDFAELKKIDENTDELEEKADGGMASLLAGLIPAMVAGIAPLMAMLLPALGAIALPLVAVVASIAAIVLVVKAFKGFGEMRAAQKEAKASETRGVEGNAKLKEKIGVTGEEAAKVGSSVNSMVSAGKTDEEIKAAIKEKNPGIKDEYLDAKVAAARKPADEKNNTPATATPATAAAALPGTTMGAPATAAAALPGTTMGAPATAASVAAAASISTGAAGASASGRVPAQEAIEQKSVVPSAAPTIINNNTDNSKKSSSSGGGQSSGGAEISLRDVHNSYMRFQEKRMARVM